MEQINKILAFLTLVACGSLPESIAIDPLMKQEHRTITEDALDHWCDAVGFCPTVVISQGAAVIVLSNDYGSFGRKEGSAAFNDGSGMIVIDNEGLAMNDGVSFWVAVAHEIGHFGIDGHVDHEGSLMNSRVDASTMALCIDQATVNEWCEQNDCDGTQRSTCE